MTKPLSLGLILSALSSLLAALPPLLVATHARADADDAINLTAGVNVQHHSNLFLLPSGVDPQAVLGTSTKSDLISTASVGLKLNKPYSLQRFELEATVVDNRYRTFSYLDFTALNYAAAWRWKLTPSLYGNLTATRTESLNSFSDYRRYDNQNLRVDENQRFDGIYEIDGNWRIVGGLARITRTNSEVFVQEGDNRINAVNAGIRYDFRSGSSLSYMAKTGRGEYMNRPQPIPVLLLDNRFDERENALHLLWKITGKANIDARAAYLERISADFSARDYSGNVGNLKLNWEISANTFLAAGWARELSSYQSISSSYTSTDRFTLAPYWRISEKTGLRLRYDHAQLEYRGAIAPTPQNGRVDTLRTGMVALEWQALRSVAVTTSLQSDRRTSNLPGNDYSTTITNISAQVSF